MENGHLLGWQPTPISLPAPVDTGCVHAGRPLVSSISSSDTNPYMSAISDRVLCSLLKPLAAPYTVTPLPQKPMSCPGTKGSGGDKVFIEGHWDIKPILH